jgi:metallo-beta-lactamase family protein
MVKADNLKLTFCGGAGSVTGANYLLESGNSRVLVDCGLFQGSKELETKNAERFSYDPKTIDAVIITHSHLDHIGRLPQLIAGGFAGKIFATPPTIDFTRLILEDSVKILMEKAEHAGVLPLFGQREVDHVMDHFVAVDYYQKTKAAEGIDFTYHEAGHILGSAVAEVEVVDLSLSAETDPERASKKIIFSGDLGNPPVPLLRAPDFLEEADYIILESTYGDRNHEPAATCQEVVENAIEDTVARCGVLMIPSFAMERTQQLLYHLNNLAENHRIPRLPIFIDSPLAIKITEVYKKYPQYYNKEAIFNIDSGDDIFKFPGLEFTEASKDSKKINNVPPPKVIIAGSGMSQGGRIMHHELLYLGDPQNTLLIITYQAEGTLGRKIAEGAKRVEILDREVAVRAKVQMLSGYSAHADQQFLMEWVRHFKKNHQVDRGKGQGLKKVFVVQGEEGSSKTLAGLIKDELGIESYIPQPGEAIDL